MVYFPVRKCYHAVKITFLIVLVVTVFALFEQWRGGKRNAKAMYSDPLEAEYERQILEDEARIIPGLGEGGVAATLMGDEKKLGEESEKKLAINVYLSDRIPYNRTLKDYRNPACQRVIYDAELPSASVIIIFHNEPYSVVVRTIWSVINSAKRSNPWFKHANFVDQQTGRLTNMGYPGQEPNSPYVYLKEIILVDDNSTLPDLKGKLSHYIRTRLPPDLIRILRLPDREGLMRARIRGARSARGDVLIFLDAHCEGLEDWLRPLLQRIRHKRDAVITPIIDVIDQTTFELQASESFQVGGFTFMGHFTWTEVPEREKKRRGSDIGPTWSPTMAGGLFAISRDYFWELGAYDEQMSGWGGENLEMSFRIWQCGGTLETIPCSRVGHVFRSFHPYGLPASTDTHGINTARMAEVWMDEYAELFYLHRPDLRNNPLIGDVTHRRVLREKLNCKSFQWYLDNIYKEKFVPVRDVYGYGRFKNDGTQLCLDTLQRDGDKVPLGAYPCYPRLQATQYFSLSNKGELRDEMNCASVQQTRKSKDRGKGVSRPVVMSTCHGKGREQKWVRLPSGQLQHVATSLCLTAPRTVSDVVATACNPEVVTQIWKIDYSEENDFRFNSDEDNIISEERDKRISKLRGPRSNRISRSLLSYDNNEIEDSSPAHNSSLRRHSHKVKRHRKRSHKTKHGNKKRIKNKFIIRIERTLLNGTEDHLEVDIHCKHKQLYPNNTFVRDLVTILNDKNIKVINNGRIFERNKVTEIKSPKHKKVLNKMDIESPGRPPTARAPEQPQAPVSVAQLSDLTSDTYQKPMTAPEGQFKVGLKPINQPIQGAGFGDSIDVPLVVPTGSIVRNGEEDREQHGKLIIEDFVEIKTEQTTEAVVRHKYKHKSHASTPSARTSARAHRAHRAHNKHKRVSTTQKPAKDNSDVLRLNSGDTEVMDSPVLDDSGDQDDWHVGVSRFRSRDKKNKPIMLVQDAPGSGENDLRQTRGDITSPIQQDETRIIHPPIIGDLLSDAVDSRADNTAEKERGDPDIERKHNRDIERAPVDTDVHYHKDQLTAFEPRYSRLHRRNTSTKHTDTARRNEHGAPIKLVMNTNLTFNVDDDLFTWKNRDAEDIVKEFVSELSIPSNETEISSKYVDVPHIVNGDNYVRDSDDSVVYNDSDALTAQDSLTTASDVQQHTRTEQLEASDRLSSSSSESSGE